MDDRLRRRVRDRRLPSASCAIRRRRIRVGGQPAGASISFHPSSPVLLELLTVYLTPSGPTTSPLCGLYTRRIARCRSVDARVGLLSAALHRAAAGRAQRVADRRRWPGQLIGGQRVAAVVDRRRRDTTTGLHRLIAARARGRAVAASGSDRRTTGWCPAARTARCCGTPAASPHACRARRRTGSYARRAPRWPACPAGSCSTSRWAAARWWCPPATAIRCGQEAGQARRRLVDRQAEVQCRSVFERRRHRLGDRRTLRQEHQRLLEALVVALEHVDHDLQVRQRLRQ